MILHLIGIKLIQSFVKISVKIIEEIDNLEWRGFCTHFGETNDVREEDGDTIEVLSCHLFSLISEHQKK